jgi:hypothetical protein
MPDSLIVGGTIELLAGGVVLDEGPGAGAKLMLYSHKWGAAIVDNDAVVSQLIDGERPYGERAGNRTIELSVLITGPGRNVMMQAREQLLQLVDRNAWELTYTPDGMQPIVYTCFRATIDIDQTGFKAEHQYYCIVDLTIPAFPYGRSTDLQTIGIVHDVPSQVSPIILDSFETPPGDTSTWFTTTSPRIEGTRSAYTLVKNTASRSFAAKDLTAMTSCRVYVTMAGTGLARALSLTLYDNRQRTLALGVGQRVLKGHNAWDKFEWHIPPQTGAFDLTKVTGYRLTVSGGVYLDQLAARPSWVQAAATDRGAVVSVPGVLGTARAPINLQLVRKSGNAFQQFIVHRAPRNAPSLYTPLVPYDTSAIPDGNTQVTVPLIDGIAAGPRWNGTHVVYVGFTTFGGAGNRTVTVSFRQYWNDTGICPTDHAGVSVTGVVDATQSVVPIGTTIDLPIVNMAGDNSATTWTVGITSTNTSDRFGEVLVLDTRGQTMFMSSSRTATNFWIDEPNVLNDSYDFIGRVVGGSGRSQALDVSGETAMPWVPFSLDPGDNTLLLYCPQECPDCTINLYPRWRTVRLS